MATGAPGRAGCLHTGTTPTWPHPASPVVPGSPRAATAVGAEQPQDVGAPRTHPGSCRRASHPGARLGERQGGKRKAGLLGPPKSGEERHLPPQFVQLLGSAQFGATGTTQIK